MVIFLKLHGLTFAIRKSLKQDLAKYVRFMFDTDARSSVKSCKTISVPRNIKIRNKHNVFVGTLKMAFAPFISGGLVLTEHGTRTDGTRDLRKRNDFVFIQRFVFAPLNPPGQRFFLHHQDRGLWHPLDQGFWHPLVQGFWHPKNHELWAPEHLEKTKATET